MAVTSYLRPDTAIWHNQNTSTLVITCAASQEGIADVMARLDAMRKPRAAQSPNPPTPPNPPQHSNGSWIRDILTQRLVRYIQVEGEWCLVGHPDLMIPGTRVDVTTRQGGTEPKWVGEVRMRRNGVVTCAIGEQPLAPLTPTNPVWTPPDIDD